MTTTTSTRDPARPVALAIDRQVAAIMQRPYHKVISGDAEEGFLAVVSELPGCVTAGETEEEALEMLRDAMHVWLVVALEDGAPIPDPAPMDRPVSGKMLVRMPKSLHRRLLEKAAEEGVSANQLAVSLLSKAL